MTVSTTDLSSMVSTFNMVSAEHATNVATDVSLGNTEFYESNTATESTDLLVENDEETVISNGDTTITATSSTDIETSVDVTTTSAAA